MRAGSAARTSRRVLVVDDSEDAADSLALLLEMHGHQTRVAYSGPDALDAARAFEPHAVLLDIGLPGMDGYEVARRLREGEARGAVIIAVTGYGRAEDRTRALAAGCDYHLTKPVDPDDLEKLMEQSARD